MNDARLVSTDARKPRFGWWATFAIALTLLAMLIAVGTWQTQTSAGLDASLAEITRAGLPVTAAELEAFYVAPPKGLDTTSLWIQGAAALNVAAYQQAAKDLPVVGTDARVPPSGQPWSELPAAADLLKQYQPSLAMFHQAAAQGSAARYPTNFALGMRMPLPHAQNLRAASRLLALEAHVRAHRGDAAGAAQSIQTMLGLGRSLENEPLPVSQLVRMACDDVARRQLTELLPQVGFSDQELCSLQERLSQIEYESGLRRALAGERVIGQQELHDLGLAAAWMQASAQQVYLDVLEKMLTASQAPWPRALAESHQVERELKANLETASGLGRTKYTLAAPVVQSLERLFEAAARSRARNDATMAAIAMERHRRRQGSLPEDLTQLVPELLPTVPVDPFSGRPLRYVVDDDGYVIYNIGADGIDNQGEGDDSGKPDDVLRIKLPPK